MRNLREELCVRVCVSLCVSSLSDERKGALTVKPSRMLGRSEMAPRQGDSGIMRDARTAAHATSLCQAVSVTYSVPIKILACTSARLHYMTLTLWIHTV